jgi:hypothetical protein
MAPQNAHILIPRIYEYVALHGKWYCADVIKFKIWTPEMEN